MTAEKDDAKPAAKRGSKKAAAENATDAPKTAAPKSAAPKSAATKAAAKQARKPAAPRKPRATGQDPAPAPETGQSAPFATEDGDEMVRQSAYFIWEREGRPHGRADEHWSEARRAIGFDDGDQDFRAGGDDATG
jgi:hypothetical protein